MKKKVILFIIATFLFSSFVGITGFSLNLVYARNEDPVVSPNQGSGPFPPLSIKERILRNKKSQSIKNGFPSSLKTLILLICQCRR